MLLSSYCIGIEAIEENVDTPERMKTTNSNSAKTTFWSEFINLWQSY